MGNPNINRHNKKFRNTYKTAEVIHRKNATNETKMHKQKTCETYKIQMK